MRMVLVCPKCTHENPLGELTCGRCPTSIIGIKPTPATATEAGMEERLEDENTHQEGESTYSHPSLVEHSSEEIEVDLSSESECSSLEIRLSTGAIIPVDEGILLGRDSKAANKEVLKEVQQILTVSRLHAWLGKIDSQFYLIDLNSNNGTFINGSRPGVNTPVRISLDQLPIKIGLGKNFYFNLVQKES